MKDDLGERMKFYEKQMGERLLPMIPAMARLDGKCFHNFCGDIERPFDPKMSDMMIRTAEFLVAKTNADIGYTQSDEISLCWHESEYKSQIFFGGRIYKMNSVLAAMCSVYFNRILPEYFPKKVEKYPLFDCRVWNVPTKEEAANALLWRERDATKNSISMAARAHFTHQEVNGLNRSEMMDMLMEKGVNWNDYDSRFKRGTFIQKREKVRKYTADERLLLSDNHPAKNDPDFNFIRKAMCYLDMPPFTKVTNRIGVIFDKENPKTESEDK